MKLGEVKKRTVMNGPRLPRQRWCSWPPPPHACPVQGLHSQLCSFSCYYTSVLISCCCQFAAQVLSQCVGTTPNTQTHFSPCKFNLSTLTSEVIKLARKCMNSTFLSNSSLRARKGETVSMVKLFQTNSEKKKNTTWSKNIIILAKQGFSFATVLTGKDCTALLPSWCQWCCWLSPFGKCQFSRAMGRVSTVEGGGFSWRI